MTIAGNDALLASLVAQSEGRVLDFVTLRALVEESSQAGARRALGALGEVSLQRVGGDLVGLAQFQRFGLAVQGDGVLCGGRVVEAGAGLFGGHFESCCLRGGAHLLRLLLLQCHGCEVPLNRKNLRALRADGGVQCHPTGDARKVALPRGPRQRHHSTGRRPAFAPAPSHHPIESLRRLRDSPGTPVNRSHAPDDARDGQNCEPGPSLVP